MGLENLKQMPIENASMEDIAVDGLQRHENSILANVPSGLADKGVLSVRLFMYFMDMDTISEYTGRKTYMNVEESYIMSGVYDDDYLSKIYKVWKEPVEMEKHGATWTEYVTKFKVLNKREDMRIRSEATRYWNDNGLSAYFEQIALAKMGNIDPEKLIRTQIIADSLRDGENQIANRKMAIDILGMKLKKKTEALNLKTRGGGQIIETTSQREGAGFLKSAQILEAEYDEDDEQDVNDELENDDFDSGFRLEGDDE